MRYLPLTAQDRSAMLEKIGTTSVDDLFADVPASAWLKGPIANLPNHKSEMEVERTLTALAHKNIAAGSVPFFCGAGAYRHHVPASVDQLLLRGEFLTSYTPYQPEVSQGTLQYLFEFQTQVSMLTGMPVANASMYDGSTGTVEAVMMANRVTKRDGAILSGGLHPHYRDVVKTHSELSGFTIDCLPPSIKATENLIKKITPETSCVVVQTPDVWGNVHDVTALANACHAQGALLIVVVTEVISLGLLPSPGSMGADIVVCEGQSIGNGLNFGGPYVGLFATKEEYIRQMPGRICGQTVDAEGARGFVLTLSTREQHIRREKATSNICTNSGLCALAFTMHLTLLGQEGLKKLARLNHTLAVQAVDRLAKISGVTILNKGFFNEFALELSKPAAAIVERLAAQRILAGVPASRLDAAPELRNILLVAVTETTTAEHIETLALALEKECAA
ncbi:MAG: aminomethyl-transferring glycine dehydrogenase subunit GcvPA [Alphaproteobacteria bacterium]|nr:aminomethyl-transferring glycine dehydrogenase subunit GcvPA [Alphaproteobacteria bacterium]